VQDGLLHRHAGEGLAEVVTLTLVLYRAVAVDLQRHGPQHLLGEVHQVVVIRVGLVELQHGELGVVAGGEPLVAEVAVDLVDPLETAYHQPLQIELRGDAQEQVHVQGVMVGGEGTRHRPAGDGLHHRRLHLQELPGVEEAADELDDAGASLEGLAGGLVHDQVQVAPAIALLLVAESVELLRQRPQGLGQQAHRVGLDRQLAGLGLEQQPLRADDVAQVQVLLEQAGGRRFRAGLRGQPQLPQRGALHL